MKNVYTLGRKYRPCCFEKIVLDENNKEFLNNMVNIIIFQIYYFMVLQVLENNYYY